MRYWYIYETEHEIQEGAIARCMRGKEVVRCSECRSHVRNMQIDRFDATDYSGDDIVCSYFMTDGMEADDFCSKGEFSPQTVKNKIR